MSVSFNPFHVNLLKLVIKVLKSALNPCNKSTQASDSFSEITQICSDYYSRRVITVKVHWFPAAKVHKYVVKLF